MSDWAAPPFQSTARGVQRFYDWIVYHRLAVLAIIGTFTFHAGLLFQGTFRATYDAFVHIFFADHYARGWFDLWEERWYTGFTMVSYPPLTHQINAILSHFTSLPTGFIILLLTSTLVTTIGVYRFSRLWVGHRAAGYAALLAVFSSSIAETVHVFGQSPTMFVIGILLNALPFIWFYVEDGSTVNLFRAWAIIMIAVAGHHVTTIFGMVFFCGPLMATILWRKFRTPRYSELHDPITKVTLRTLPRLLVRRIKRVAPAFVRCGIFGVGFIIIGVGTVLPYWLWSRSDPISQVTIPHGSRLNFIDNPNIGFMFFLVPWGTLLLILPYALYKGFTSRNWILAASLAMLSLLGTGGTTPIPAFLLRGAFYILTLDRFTFWATIIILPFAGVFVESLLHGRFGQWITAQIGAVWRTLIIVTFFGAMIGIAVFVANLTQFRKFQPDPIDMQPIVEFLAKDNHDRWRYMTLGFGDQLAWLSAQTTALNVEGNYHSARRLPEMTSTPIERLDGAKFQALPGLGSLHQFLSNPHRYHLKYIFMADDFYQPLLHFYGWHRLGPLENDVLVWERADVPPLPVAIPQVDYPDWQRLLWGILPLSSLFLTVITLFTTYLVVPRTRVNPLRWPLLGRLFRWRVFKQWLIEQPMCLDHQPDNQWQLWRRITDRLPPIRVQPRVRNTLYGLVLAVALCAIIAASMRTIQREVHSPAAILLNYYDDVDFQRFSESYQWLETDLSRQEYLRYLSLRGGLVASFSKLENFHIDALQLEGDQATATLTLDWLTALGSYPETVTHQLRRTGSGWRIVLDVAPPEPPVEVLLTTQTTQFFIDLPLTSLADGALNRGTLSRSVLSVGEVRTVVLPDRPIGFVPEDFEIDRFEGRWEGLLSIIGIVQNQDALPAHVTITALFRDQQGRRIAEANAADALIHQLLPGEVSPFRIDLVGAAATTLLDLDDVGSIELIARGVPTQYNLERPLILFDKETIYNGGAQAVDIPRLLRTQRDADGALLWVESVFLEQAIDPGALLTFDELAHTHPQPIDIPISITGPRLRPWQTGQTQQLPQVLVTGFTR